MTARDLWQLEVRGANNAVLALKLDVTQPDQVASAASTCW